MNIKLLGFRLIRVRELDGLHAQLTQREERQEESERQIAELTQRLREAEEELAAAGSSARDPDDSTTPGGVPPGQEPELGWNGISGPPPVVRELISVVDGLTDLTGTSALSDPQQAGAALRWVQVRTQSLLTACGIASIEDSGHLDLRRHEVVASRAAPQEGLVDQIADTVRPGYEWHGSLVRPQQVIAYVPASEVTELGTSPRPPGPGRRPRIKTVQRADRR